MSYNKKESKKLKSEVKVTSKERLIPLLNGGHPSPIDDDQAEIVEALLDVVQEVIRNEKVLVFRQAAVIDDQFWLKMADGGFLVINPNPEIQTIRFANEDLEIQAENFAILEENIIAEINHLSGMIEELVS